MKPISRISGKTVISRFFTNEKLHSTILNRTYSKRNCEMECQSRVIEDKCGCVIFYMPRLSPQTKICGRVDVSCYRDVKLSVEKGELTKNCYCLPACSELSFTGTTSSAPIVSNLIYSNDAMLKNFTNDKLR